MALQLCRPLPSRCVTWMLWEPTTQQTCDNQYPGMRGYPSLTCVERGPSKQVVSFIVTGPLLRSPSLWLGADAPCPPARATSSMRPWDSILSTEVSRARRPTHKRGISPCQGFGSDEDCGVGRIRGDSVATWQTGPWEEWMTSGDDNTTTW